MELSPLIYVAIFVLGLLFGSFFNVAIHRWPMEDKKQREWVITGSRCPKCGHSIRWFDNIPLLSYLVLRGRCRDCKTPIHWRYPAVELGNAILWTVTAWLVANVGFTGVAAANHTGWHIFFAIVFASLYLLTVIIDAQTQLIPDEITISHFVFSVLFLLLCSGATISGGWLPSLIGMAALAAFYFIFAWFGAMGFGDVMLALGIGLLFGWPLIIEQGFLSIVLGGIPAIFLLIWLIVRGRYKPGKIHIAFGPFIGIAAYISMFWGYDLAYWYLTLFMPAERAAAALGL